MKKIRIFAVAIYLAICAVSLSWADVPLPPPSVDTVCSTSKQFCAELIPTKDTVIYKVLSNGSKKQLWSVPGWHRSAYISDDGTYFATCYGELIPQDYSTQLVMVQFWSKEGKSAEVKLGSLIHNMHKLERTVSHVYWGVCKGFEPSGQFIISTVEQSNLFVTPSNGKVSKTRR